MMKLEDFKSYFHALKETAKVNVDGCYCPNCAIPFDKPTIYAHTKWNSLYHKFGVYMKCTVCNLVTPVYDDIESAIDNIEDQWVNKEVELFEEG